MSIDATLSSRLVALALPEEARDALAVFVADAHAVAEAVDPMLARLLAEMLGPAPSDERRADWRGDRREGLELCQRLLGYLRQDVTDRRLDVTLDYIAIELGSLAQPDSMAQSAH